LQFKFLLRGAEAGGVFYLSRGKINLPWVRNLLTHRKLCSILLNVVGICLVLLKKWGAIKDSDQKEVMMVNRGGLWDKKELQRPRCLVKNYD